jgi:hypothetical protein
MEPSPLKDWDPKSVDRDHLRISLFLLESPLFVQDTEFFTFQSTL